MCKIRSIKQAADYFKQLDPETQITEYTLRKLIADGTIPSIKTGNKHLVNLDQVLSLFEPACVSTAEQLNSPFFGVIESFTEKKFGS